VLTTRTGPHFNKQKTRERDYRQLILALRYNGHFPGGPGFSRYPNVSILDFIGAKDDGGGDDN